MLESFGDFGEVDLDEVVELARMSVSNSNGKFYVTREEMLAILDDGAEIIYNRPEIGGKYCINVRYQGIVFVNASWYPIFTNKDLAEHYLDCTIQ